MALLNLYLNHFLLFTLVLARLSGLVMTAPIFGSQDVPVQVRGFLAFALAILITPLQSASGFQPPEDLLNYAIVIAAELIIGLALGLGLMLLFSGIQLTGQIIAQMGGMSLADVF